MQQHVKTLGILFIVFGAIGLVVAAFLFLIIGGAGALSGDRDAAWITGTVGLAVAGFVAILSIPGIITGFGLLNFRPWARIVAIIVAALHILSFPFGTALAIYAFWVLLKPEVAAMFEHRALPA